MKRPERLKRGKLVSKAERKLIAKPKAVCLNHLSRHQQRDDERSYSQSSIETVSLKEVYQSGYKLPFVEENKRVKDLTRMFH